VPGDKKLTDSWSAEAKLAIFIPCNVNLFYFILFYFNISQAIQEI